LKFDRRPLASNCPICPNLPTIHFIHAQLGGPDRGPFWGFQLVS